MYRLKVSQLKPKMKLARTIYNHQGNVLIMAGNSLTPKIISILEKLGISAVWVEGEEEIFVKDVVNIETRITAIKQVENILLKTKESGKLVIEPQDLYKSVSSFANELFDAEELLYSLSDLRTQDNYTFIHSVNVCILSMMTGISLGYGKEDICTIGIGALLHDLGKVLIPDKILNKPGPLSSDEFSIMKKHTIFGYELITESGVLGDVPARIALEHHETYDGSGYPMGISDKNIHRFSQIVAIADKFDAITANRVYRKAFPPFEAYEMCAAAGNYLFDEDIVQAFMHNITPYPPGTHVQLSNGLVGVCVNIKKGFSMFPVVRLLFDENLKPLKQDTEISLYENHGIYITKVLPNQSLSISG